MDDIELVNVLLDNNSNVNDKNDFGETALIKCKI